MYSTNTPGATAVHSINIYCIHTRFMELFESPNRKDIHSFMSCNLGEGNKEQRKAITIKILGPVVHVP